mgnify:CR=1 FL=1|tara:strand:- start:373 stop:924 length:552 start_codon:yes stop_codon:yes gene_type:complete
MKLPDDLFRIVTEFAWKVPFTNEQLRVQLDCCADCQACIPIWFLDDVIYFFPSPGEMPPFWTLKIFNPLVAGAPYSPFDIRTARLNSRACTWLFESIRIVYLRRKRMLRKPLYRMLEMPLIRAWATFLDRLGDLTLNDVLPSGYMASLITHSMLLNLGLAGRLSNWTPLFDSFWPHGLPSAGV